MYIFSMLPHSTETNWPHFIQRCYVIVCDFVGILLIFWVYKGIVYILLPQLTFPVYWPAMGEETLEWLIDKSHHVLCF